MALPRGVLVRETIASTLILDELRVAAVADPAVFDAHVRRRLTAELRDYAASFGFDVTEHSIWFEMESSIMPPGARITAIWAPNPEIGCELRGGPADGLVYAIPRGDHGRPARTWRFIQPAPRPFDFTAATRPQHPEQIATIEIEYARAGIDSMRDCWVYEYRHTS